MTIFHSKFSIYLSSDFGVCLTSWDWKCHVLFDDFINKFLWSRRPPLFISISLFLSFTHTLSLSLPSLSYPFSHNLSLFLPLSLSLFLPSLTHPLFSHIFHARHELTFPTQVSKSKQEFDVIEAFEFCCQKKIPDLLSFLGSTSYSNTWANCGQLWPECNSHLVLFFFWGTRLKTLQITPIDTINI